MKRSRKLVLSTAMAAGGLSLAACDQGGQNVRIENPGPSTDAYAYSSLAECKAKHEVPTEACEKAEKAAWDDNAKASRYGDQTTCEDVYGPGQCVPRSAVGGGGSFWGPLVAGFVIGRMMDGGWAGRGLYRDWRDGGYYTASGSRLWNDYGTGRARVSQRSFDAPDVIAGPPKMMSRTGAISRGGFGGRMSSRGYGGGFHGGFGG